MTPNEHVQALRNLLMADHQHSVATFHSYADEAHALGEFDREQRWRERARTRSEIPFPWDEDASP